MPVINSVASEQIYEPDKASVINNCKGVFGKEVMCEDESAYI